jgi:hypothetical protein
MAGGWRRLDGVEEGPGSRKRAKFDPDQGRVREA